VDVEHLDLGVGLLLHDLGDRAVQAGHVGDDREDVLAGGHRHLDVHPRLDLDVVDGDDVGGVGHRHHERVLARPRHRDELAAAGDVGRQEVDRRHVEAVLGEVQEVQAETLRDRARPLLGRDHALIDQELIGGGAGVAGRQHGGLDPFARREAEIDDDLGQESHRRAAVAARRRHGSGLRPRWFGGKGGSDARRGRGELFAHALLIGGLRRRSSPSRRVRKCDAKASRRPVVAQAGASNADDRGGTAHDEAWNH
jgi:hypothetical protein